MGQNGGQIPVSAISVADIETFCSTAAEEENKINSYNDELHEKEEEQDNTYLDFNTCLEEFKCDTSFMCSRDSNNFIQMCGHGDWEGVFSFLKDNRINQTTRNEGFVTACEQNQLNILKILLETDIELKFVQIGFNQASKYQNIDVLYLILKKRSGLKMTQIFLQACQNNFLNIVQLALTSTSERLPIEVGLFKAAQNQCYEVAEFLIYDSEIGMEQRLNRHICLYGAQDFANILKHLFKINQWCDLRAWLEKSIVFDEPISNKSFFSSSKRRKWFKKLQMDF